MIKYGIYDKFIHQCSIEFNLPKDVIVEILDNMFSVIKEDISKEKDPLEFKSYILPLFGKLYVKDKKKKYLHEVRNKTKDDNK